MAYVIREGDPTTTGGRVLAGSTTVNVEYRKAARISDPVWCPKCSSMGFIAEGNPTFIVEGVAVATHGHAVQCGCPLGSNRLIATQGTVMAAEDGSVTIAPEFAAQAQAATHVWAKAIADGSYNSEYTRDIPTQGLTGLTGTGSSSTDPTPATLQTVEPGFHIVQQSMTRDALEATLFEQPTPAVLDKFRTLNPQLSNGAKPGHLVVLSDPKNLQCTREETVLMEAASKVNDALKPLSAEEASFLHRHRDEIETFLAQGSTSIGIGEAMFAKNLSDVKNVLRDIELLHQRAFQADGNLRSPGFFAERKRLLGQLNTQLTSMTRKGIGLPDHPNLKSALGISSRSLVHQWTKAGAPGQIPGYATHLEGVARAAKVIKYGGWIGTAIGGGASYMKVQDVCAAGDTEACEKVKFTEVGGFIGGVAGGAASGVILSGSTAGAICVALGVPTGGIGTLVCGLVVVGAGSLAAGVALGKTGEKTGEIIYEVTK